jgi:hypothetical protein
MTSNINKHVAAPEPKSELPADPQWNELWEILAIRFQRSIDRRPAYVADTRSLADSHELLN